MPGRSVEMPAQRDAHPQLRLVVAHPQPGTEQVAERPVRDRPAVADAATLEPQRPSVLGRVRAERPAELVHHARLADARLARHDDDAARAGRGRLDGGAQARELAVSTHGASRRAGIGARGGALRDAVERERGDRLGLALQVERLGIAPQEAIGHALLGGGTHEHAAGRCVRLQPGRDVHRIAQRRVLDAAAGADRARHDRAGVDAGTHVQRVDAPGFLDLAGERGDVVDDAHRCADGPLGVVLVRDRGPEEREHAVAGEVLHGAAERFHRGHHASDRIADDELQLLGVEAFPERRRADEVGEQRGHVTAFVADLHGVHPDARGGHRQRRRGQSAGRRAARTNSSTSRSRRRSDAWPVSDPDHRVQHAGLGERADDRRVQREQQHRRVLLADLARVHARLQELDRAQP